MTATTLRQGIPHVDTFIHLNNAAASLPDAGVQAAILAHLALDAKAGSTEAMTAVSNQLEQLYRAAARRLGGTAEQIVITDSHTSA